MTRDAPVTADVLEPHEVHVLKSLVRQAYRKSLRGRASAARKWGEGFDPEAFDIREDILRSAYRKLGGDPLNITVAESEG